MKKIKIGDCFKDGEHTLLIDNAHPFAYHCFQVLTVAGGTSAVGSMGLLDRWEIQARFALLPTLHLPIGNNAKKYGGAWFDMIRSGVKTEEYREIWGQSGLGRNIALLGTTNAKDAKIEFERMTSDYGDGARAIFADHLRSHCWVSKKVLHLTNGYGHDKPQLWANIEEITIGKGKPEWGAPADDVFIIRLGKVFHTKNLK